LPSGTEVIRRYLNDAIAAERAFESQLRSFANDASDDQEIQLFFADHADETNAQIERLTARLAALASEEEAKSKTLAANLLSFAPKFVQAGHTAEERIVQNLIAAYCIEAGESAMYEALAQAAQLAGDSDTADLARQSQGQERRAAQSIFRFLPTRSKIALNLLTADEVDPAVQTKAGII
jgi:ferritin-like metal-binding protein YciE